MSDDPIDTSSERLRVDDREQAYQTALALIKQARKDICFFGANLDPVLFDQPEMIDLLSHFARRHPQTQLRFVVHSTSRNIADSHRLINLAQRLGSSVHIHISSEQDQTLQQMFLLTDSNGYLYCHNNQSYHGHAGFAAAAKVKKLRHEFDQLWAASHPDSHTRRLYL